MSALAVGDTILGKYRIERVIGEGGMGWVFRARHLHLDDRVAIKVLKIDAKTPTTMVKRFLLEARAARRIRNEHVVQVTDLDTLITGEPYMVMEYLVGSDLSKLPIAPGTMEVETAVDYVLQALEALAEAHAQGIIHRDLKPANLFLTKRSDGTPLIKVLDFGISKFRDLCAGDRDEQLTHTGTTLGTPSYMAPEQIQSPQHIDARADIWALGVVLYNLLTGALPFTLKGDRAPQIIVRALTLDPITLSALRPGLPKKLEAIIMRCLQKSASKRFRDVGELAAALQPFASSAARPSLERISRVINASTDPLYDRLVPGGMSPGEALTHDDASGEMRLDGRRSQSPDTLVQTGMSRTLDRLKAAARTTGMMAFAGLVCAALLGLVVSITLSRRFVERPAIAMPSIRIPWNGRPQAEATGALPARESLTGAATATPDVTRQNNVQKGTRAPTPTASPTVPPVGPTHAPVVASARAKNGGNSATDQQEAKRSQAPPKPDKRFIAPDDR